MTIWEAFDLVMAEYNISIDKHGDWSDYSVDQMMSVIINELMVEAGGAEAIGDLHGDHGVIRELSQVAACCLKAIMVLTYRPQETLALHGRPEGAQLCLEGRVPPASPFLHQSKESTTNCPMGGSLT